MHKHNSECGKNFQANGSPPLLPWRMMEMSLPITEIKRGGDNDFLNQ
jgi:hypothetical protein